jgi:hypothetical protein
MRGDPKNVIPLARFPTSPGAVNHRLRYIMKKVYERIERRIGPATVAQVL